MADKQTGIKAVHNDGGESLFNTVFPEWEIYLDDMRRMD